jgi:DNA-directed RNA polymerase subunit beta
MSYERKNFGKLREVIPPPNLIENQILSYQEFLQMETPTANRDNVGLESVFKEVFPVESNNGNFRLEYLDYTLTANKIHELECIREGTTFSVSLLLKLRLVEKGSFKDEEILMGDLPMITDRGSFIPILLHGYSIHRTF